MLQELLPEQAGRGRRVDDEIDALLRMALVLHHFMNTRHFWGDLLLRVAARTPVGISGWPCPRRRPILCSSDPVCP